MLALGLSGSLRRDSHNTQLLRAAGELLPPGVKLASYDGIRELPLYDADLPHNPAPQPVERLRAAVREADAVLVATPEYNRSIPGVLKNALDWLSRPLADSPIRGKPVVIGGSTGSFGAVWGQAETRKVLAAIGAQVLDRELPVPNIDGQFDPDGRLLDEALVQSLGETLNELLAQAGHEFAAVRAA
ncbi:MAG: NADPH-dependent FMN reductase [Solirubrobacteraceae bacterium]